MKRSPLTRRTPLRSRGRKNRHPRLRESREVVMERSRGWCEALTPVCERRGTMAHHRRMRSQGGDDSPDNLLWVCAFCHWWIHDHPAESYDRGLLVRGVH